MKKLLVILAAFALIITFTVPAVAAPRASPISLVDMMMTPTATAPNHQTFLDLTSISTIAAQDGTLILPGNLYLFAPVAFNDAMKSIATTGQRHSAAYTILNWTNTFMSATVTRNAFTGANIGTLRL